MSGEHGLSASDLTAVLEHLRSGVVVVDAAGHPLLTNQAARALLGRALDSADPIMNLVTRVDLREAQSGRQVQPSSTPLARALRGESISDEEFTLTVPGRPELFRLLVSAIPMFDAAGQPSGAMAVLTDRSNEINQAKRVACSLRDEQRARAETQDALARLEQELAERRRAEEALQRSQQRLRLALEASHMVTWDYDVVNDRVASESPELVAESSEDPSIASLDHVLQTIEPADRESVQAAIREALDHGHSLQVEARVAQQDPAERSRWYLIKGRVYRDQRGSPLRMTGIAMDITERKEAEAVRHSLARGERLRALGEMAGGIVHDLNQSLALITGYSDMVRQELSQGVPEVSRMREMIDITARAAFEGGKALRGLLSFVRSQDLMAEIERINVGEALDDIARLTAPRWRDYAQANGRPITLRVRADAGCWINGSPAQLREAITNLIFNAVDALPFGGTIDLRAGLIGEHVNVEVSDSGTGMPPEVKARVFDPFFTTKGEQGTGLGLPQVLAIVEKHGGTIELDSTPERGTTFRMKFPRASQPTASGQAEDTPVPETMPKRGIRVLIVEDEEQLARMARIVLGQHGHQVVVSMSGEDAIQQLQESRFDLVISDLGLGAGKNGWDVAAEVRQRWPGTRFVLVTGWGAAIDPKEAEPRGVHQVIAKPYRIADLRQVADRVAEAQSTQEQSKG